MSDRIVESCAPATPPSRSSRCADVARSFGDVDGAARRRSGGPRRRGRRAARPERRRQDDARPHHRHAPRPRRRPVAGVRGERRHGRQRRCARHLGLAGQFASVDELLTGRENLELIGRLYGTRRRRLPRSCRRAARARSGLTERRRSPGGHLLGRDAPPARPRRHPDRRTVVAAARRTHHRPRPAQPPGAVGPHRRHREARHGRAHHQPEPRRDRAARRPRGRARRR